MEKVMEQLKQCLQQKLDKDLKKWKFIIKETKDITPKTLNFCLSENGYPFMGISASDKIDICFFVVKQQDDFRRLYDAVSPQITVLPSAGNKFLVVINKFGDKNNMKKVEMDFDEIITLIFDTIKERLGD